MGSWPPRSDEVFKCLWEALKRAPQCDLLPVGDWLGQGIRASTVMVGLSATPLPAVPLANRRLITIYNNSDYPIYLGQVGICASAGLPLAASQPYSINLGDTVPIYGVAGICEAGLSPCDIRILEGV